MLAGRLEVVLETGEHIRNPVHLIGGRDSPRTKQFTIDEAREGDRDQRWLGLLQDAQGARDLGEHAAHAAKLFVIPRRLDEGDEIVLDPLQIEASLAGDRLDHSARLAAGDLILAALDSSPLLAEHLDLVIQGALDVEKGSGDVEQGAFLDWPLAAHHRRQRRALFGHQRTRRVKTEHRERIAHAGEDLKIGFERSSALLPTPQVDIERVLHFEQIFLDRLRHRVEQSPIVTGDRALRVLRLATAGPQIAEPERAPDRLESRRLGRKARDLIEQTAQELARRVHPKTELSLHRQPFDLAFELTEQQLQLVVGTPTDLGERIHQARAHPPKLSRGFLVAEFGEPFEDRRHAMKTGIALAALEPREKRTLEPRPQPLRDETELHDRRRSRRAGDARRKRQAEVGENRTCSPIWACP